MDLVGGIVVFVICWWLSFFCVLPIGVQGQFEDEGTVIEGSEEGAPNEPMLKKYVRWDSIGAVFLTLIAHFFVVPWLAAS